MTTTDRPPTPATAAPEPAIPETAAAALHPSQGRNEHVLSTDLLVDIASGLATALEHGALAHPSAPPVGLTRERVLATATYDVWVHAWAPGAMADVHDHDGSVVVVRLLDGSLTEELDSVDGHATVIRLLGSGSVTELDALAAHRLANPFPAPALSIHVYSPPVGDGEGR